MSKAKCYNIISNLDSKYILYREIHVIQTKTIVKQNKQIFEKRVFETYIVLMAYYIIRAPYYIYNKRNKIFDCSPNQIHAILLGDKFLHHYKRVRAWRTTTINDRVVSRIIIIIFFLSTLYIIVTVCVLHYITGRIEIRRRTLDQFLQFFSVKISVSPRAVLTN